MRWTAISTDPRAESNPSNPSKPPNPPNPSDPSNGPFEATGPDQVRVTILIATAIDRYRRLRSLWSAPALITDPFGTYVDLRTLPGLIQKYVLRDRWAVRVEADNGLRYRVEVRSREHALARATTLREGVAQEGTTVLRRLLA